MELDLPECRQPESQKAGGRNSELQKIRRQTAVSGHGR